MPHTPTQSSYSGRSLLILALLCALVVTGIQALKKDFKVPVADATIYLTGGAVLEKTGRYDLSRHWLVEDGNPGDENRDHRIMPGVSFLYAVMMGLDSQFKNYSYCHLLKQKPDGDCGDPGLLVKAAQILVLGMAAWIGYLIALAVTGRQIIAWLALAAMLASGRYGLYARQFLSDGYTLLAVSSVMFCLVSYVRRPSLLVAVFLALALVVGSYFRPSIIYAFYLLALAGAGGCLWGWLLKREVSVRPVHLAALLLIYTGLMFPWAARNAALTGQYFLTDGYAGYILVQRLAYNMMTFQEWCAAWIYWLPDFGDSLAAKLFDPAAYQRLSVIHPEGFYSIGNRAFADEMQAAAGSDENFMPYLMSELRSNLFTHIWVTFPMLTHGLWVGKIFGLISFILTLPALILMKKRGQLALYFLAALVPVFLLGLHAFASVNIPRYNLALLPILSIGAAVSLHAMGCFMAGKSKQIVGKWSG